MKLNRVGLRQLPQHLGNDKIRPQPIKPIKQRESEAITFKCRLSGLSSTSFNSSKSASKSLIKLKKNTKQLVLNNRNDVENAENESLTIEEEEWDWVKKFDFL